MSLCCKDFVLFYNKYTKTKSFGFDFHSKYWSDQWLPIRKCPQKQEKQRFAHCAAGKKKNPISALVEWMSLNCTHVENWGPLACCAVSSLLLKAAAIQDHDREDVGGKDGPPKSTWGSTAGFRSQPGNRRRQQLPVPSRGTRRRPWWPPPSLPRAATPSCKVTEG